eukprot:11791255-Karenia_brevis.AAC.1
MGVHRRYVALLASLYSNQEGLVKTDCCSKRFAICRGTKQGDPLSPILFNAVLQKAMEKIQEDWRQKGLGIDVGFGQLSSLCNLRFADDILIIASSNADLKRMLQDVSEATRDIGLKMHMGKT